MKKNTIFALLLTIFLLISCSSEKEYNEALTIFNSDAPDRHEKAIMILEDIPLYFSLSHRSTIRFKNEKWYYKARDLKDDIIEDFKTVERNYLNNYYKKSLLVYVDDVSEELFISSIDGGITEKVNYKGTFYRPRWSPNGDYFLFTGMSEEDYNTGIKDNIFIADRAGERVKRLTHNRYKELSAAWSHDSKRIVFAREKGMTWELVVFNLETMSEIVIFPTGKEVVDYVLATPIFLPNSYDILARFGGELKVVKENSSTLTEPFDFFGVNNKEGLPEWAQKPVSIGGFKFSYDYNELFFTTGGGFTVGDNFVYSLDNKKINRISANGGASLSPDSRYIVIDNVSSEGYELAICKRYSDVNKILPYIKLHKGRDADWSPWLE